MPIVSRLTSSGDHSVTGEYDEYTILNSSYATQFNGSQYLSTPNSNAFALTGNFTIECWAYFNDFSDYRSVIGMYPNGAYSGEWIFQHITGTNKMGFYLSTIGSITSGPTTLSTNTWYHIAMVRSGTTITAYINGVSQGTLTSSATIGYNNGPLYIGAPQNIGSARMNGFISNVRIVNGTALYTSDFTPPISPLTAITNTSFLTCQNSTIIDNSTNALTITNNGAATTSIVPTKFYTGLFNGSNQYLSIASNAAFDIWGTSGNATLEFWYRSINASKIGHIFVMGPNSTNRTYMISNGSTLTLGTAIGGTYTTRITSGVSVVQNTWYHIAVVRIGSSYTLYVNGVSQGSSSGSLYNGGGAGVPVYIGTQPFSPLAADWYNGYISNFRIVNGTALYTSNFTPPTKQLTAISGTSLLTLNSPTVIDNSNNRFTISNNNTVPVYNPTFGTVKRELSNGVFQTFDDIDEYTMPNSTYAVSFNGSNQYLIAPSNVDFAFPGDFTIEGWFYKSSAWTNTFDFVQALGTNGISFYAASSTIRSGPNNVSSYSLGASTGLAIRTWYHIAFVRKSNSARVYVNGVPLAAAVSDTNSYAQTELRIGGGVDGSFDGYISNVRVIKGRAIYDPALSSFTPPNSPLTSIPNTVLLTCQSPTIIDNSINALTITNANASTISNVPTTFYKTNFSGSSQYLRVPYSSAFDFSQSNWTLECWFKANVFDLVILSKDTYGTNFDFCMYVSATTIFSQTAGTAQSYSVTTGLTLTTGKWYHLAMVRSAGTLNYYLDGVKYGAGSAMGITNVSQSYVTLGCFSWNNPSGFMNGSVSNLRMVQGTALYTSNFTPPTQQLTAISGTTFLTYQSPTIIDNSTNAITITNFNSVTVEAPTDFLKTKSKLLSNGTFQVSNSFDEYSISVLNVDYLVAAGGGGGAGWGINVSGAGGGAGGLLTGSSVLARSVLYTVVIGSGGATAGRDASGGNGSDSSFIGTGISVTSKGGGKGGFWNNEAGNGGSGGGSTGGSGTVAGKGVYPGSSYIDAPRQGYDGALGSGNIGYTPSAGGGGGGAGGAGTSGGSGGAGGAGVASSITGTSVTYCGGGAGSAYNSASPSSAALGWGGRGATGNNSEYGGSGVVIIRFPNTFTDPTSTTGSPTVTNTGGYKIYQWTSSGSITF